MSYKIANFRLEIEARRTIAVISVIIFNVFPGQTPDGDIGDCIFFVIVSYPIISIIQASILANENQKRDVWVLVQMEKVAAISKVAIRDPRKLIWDAKKARPAIDREAMSFDNNHFSMNAARRFIADAAKSG